MSLKALRDAIFGSLLFTSSTLLHARPADQKVTIAQAGDFYLYAPLYIALDAGFFKGQGLDVTLITTGGDDKTWAAVLGKNASFGVADPIFAAVSGERGIKGIVVADLVNGAPFWGVTFRADIQDLYDLKRLQPIFVATFPSPSTAFALQSRVFQQLGLTPTIRQAAFGALLPLLMAGRADVALELEPNVSIAENRGAHVIYSLAQVFGPLAVTGLTTTPDVTRDSPEMVQKVVCGLQSALDYIRSDKSTSISFLSKRFPEVPEDVASRALDRVIADQIIPKSLATSTDAWGNAARLRLEVGDLKSMPDYNEYVDNSFAQSTPTKCK